MSNDIRVTNPGASTLYDALVFKSEKPAVAEQEAPVQEETQIETQDTAETTENQRGNVPGSTISFDEGPIQEQEPVQEQIQNNEELPVINEENSDELPDIEMLEQQQTEQTGDPNDLPPMTDQNQFPNETVTEDYKPETNNNHSVSKAVVHGEAYLAKGFVTKVAQSYIKGATVKAVTKELTEALAKGVTTTAAKTGGKVSLDLAAKVTAGAGKGLEKTVVGLTAKGLLGKGVATVGVKEGAIVAGNLVKGLKASAKASGEILLEGGAKRILPNTLEALGKTSIGAGEKILQKGIEQGTDIAVKAVIKNVTEEAAGKVLTEVVAKTAAKTTAKTTTKAAAKATTEVAAKTGAKLGTKVAAKTGTKVATEVAAKTGAKIGTKVTAKTGAKVVTEAAAKTAAKTTAKTTTRATGAAVEKLTAEAVTKATTEVASKGGVKLATKVGKAMPWIGTAVGVGITAWDAYDAVQKTKDPNASTISKGLAWTTVGLDVVSTATTATGKGAPIGWAATVLSVGTGIASDYLR